jgi:hypothetical protein
METEKRNIERGKRTKSRRNSSSDKVSIGVLMMSDRPLFFVVVGQNFLQFFQRRASDFPAPVSISNLFSIARAFLRFKKTRIGRY